jgi:hypothetical protein
VKAIKLFVMSCVLGGAGGFVGSVLGGAFGKTSLFAGGLIGGVLIAPMSAKFAVYRGWIEPRQYLATAAGTALGFLAAAFVAMNTLSSPVGPVLSTALTGLGALVGSVVANRRG